MTDDELAHRVRADRAPSAQRRSHRRGIDHHGRAERRPRARVQPVVRRRPLLFRRDARTMDLRRSPLGRAQGIRANAASPSPIQRYNRPTPVATSRSTGSPRATRPTTSGGRSSRCDALMPFGRGFTERQHVYTAFHRFRFAGGPRPWPDAAAPGARCTVHRPRRRGHRRADRGRFARVAVMVGRRTHPAVPAVVARRDSSPRSHPYRSRRAASSNRGHRPSRHHPA